MTKDAITLKLSELIMGVAPTALEPEELQPEKSLIDDLALDSITIVSLLALAEQTFSATLTDEPAALEEIDTIDDLAGFIAQRRESRPLAAAS